MSLANVIHQLVTDEQFRLHLKSEPQLALATAGLDLGNEELEILYSMSWDVPLSLNELYGPGWWDS
jgi:hypothetical protein